MSVKTAKMADWHTHNYFCKHAIGNLREYILSGIKCGLDTIGISDHLPNHYEERDGTLRFKDYAMSVDQIQDYIKTGIKLRNQFQRRITIKIGFEAGFWEGKESYISKKVKDYAGVIDYVIGSVHTINLEGIYYGVKSDDFPNLVDKYGGEFIYRKYFKTLRKMLASKEFDFDIIGHLDFIKNGLESPAIEDVILEEILNCLEPIKRRNVAVEVNTQGLRNGYRRLYPCKAVLELLYSKNIPITLGSDAHEPSHVAHAFDKVKRLLKKIGYTQLAYFSNRKRTAVPI